MDVNRDTQLNVELEREDISLGEVTVLAGEDPAYAIMRKAIKKEVIIANKCKVTVAKPMLKQFKS